MSRVKKMIVKDDFLNKLRHFFSLNLYEVKIWTALLSRGVSTAGELSDIGNVPRSRAYDILESLEKKGFITMRLGKPIKYLAVEPAEVVERAKKLAKQNADEKVKKLDSLKGTEFIKELNSLFKNGVEFVEPNDLSGAFRGRHNIYNHLDFLIKNAEKSVDIVTTARGLSRKIDVLKPQLEALKKKGVKIRIAAPIDKNNSAVVGSLAGIADIRHLDKINARFCVVDGRDVMFMALGDEEVHPSYDIGIWTKTPYFAGALSNMFDMVWKDLESASKVVGKLG